VRKPALTGFDEVGDAAAITKRLPSHGRIADQSVFDQRSEKFISQELRNDAFTICKLGKPAVGIPFALALHPMRQLVAVQSLRPRITLEDRSQRGERAGCAYHR
jgi:hypothetical protein